MELVGPQFQAKSLPLMLEIDDRSPRSIDTDPDKVRQILKNFFSLMRLNLPMRDQSCCRLKGWNRKRIQVFAVCISVADSGIGIAENKHAHIFEAFKQADGSTSRRYGGTGLGLTISQPTLPPARWEIRLQSREGSRSTFSLYLPPSIEVHNGEGSLVEIWEESEHAVEIIHEPSESANTLMESRIAGKRVLLVDDDIRDLLNLTPTLESWGLEVTAAGDGVEALEVLQEDDEFALVLMDIMMPKLDGYDTIKQIREHEQFRNLAIIALTAKADASDRERCLAAGANDFCNQSRWLRKC